MNIATLSMYWVIAGTFGWAIMLVYRLITNDLPKNLTIVNFITGYVLACILGFFVFPTIGIILMIKKYKE